MAMLLPCRRNSPSRLRTILAGENKILIHQSSFIICRRMGLAFYQHVEDVNEPPNLPPPSHSFPSCPVTQLLSPRGISVSNKPYWDNYLGFHPWALAFLLLSLPSSFPQILLWDKHCAYGGCIWASQPQLPHLRWIFPVLRLWWQQNKRLVSWILQAQPFCFRCGRHGMDPQLPAQAHQKTRASQGRRAPREPLTLITPLELCHLYFYVFLLPGGAGGLRIPSGTSTTPSPAPPPPVSLLPQSTGKCHNAGDCHPAGFPTRSFLQGNLGLSLALTLSSSWIRWGDGAGHPSVLPRNAHEEKQKFAARVIVKGSGTHPLFVFFSWQFQIPQKCCCQLSRTRYPQIAPEPLQAQLCPARSLGPAQGCLLWEMLLGAPDEFRVTHQSCRNVHALSQHPSGCSASSSAGCQHPSP